MDLHPLVVHFPIAFLSVYSGMELFRFRFVTAAPYWFYMKAFLVIAGSLGAGAAYLTGERAEELFQGSGLYELVELHARWAKGTTLVFGAIAAVYFVAWLTRLERVSRLELALGFSHTWPYDALKRLVNWLTTSMLMVFPALVGMAGILVTGSLGGMLVYGPERDPFARILYDLLFAR
ncbi:MAG: hypothetical protein AAB375_03175 [Patescibacteria group bacterium]